jgi:hypothetical protein
MMTELPQEKKSKPLQKAIHKQTLTKQQILEIAKQRAIRNLHKKGYMVALNKFHKTTLKHDLFEKDSWNYYFLSSTMESNTPVDKSFFEHFFIDRS